MASKKVPLPLFYSNLDESMLPAIIGGRLVNGYIEVVVENPIIRKSPGLELIATLAESAPVDVFWWDKQGIAMAVCNGKVFKINSQYGDNTDITGDALSVVGKTTFADNGTYGFFASGGRIISTNAGAATAFIADADCPTEVTHVAYLDQYLICNYVNTGYFYHSDFNSPLDWTATSFFNAESKPDIIKALHVHDREVSLFGENSIEIWVPNASGSTFIRMDGAYIERGTIASNSVIHQYGNYLWMDHERHIEKMAGRAPSILSASIGDVIRDFYPVTDCNAIGFSIGKQIFTAFTFPTMDRTFVYNHTSDTWSEWGDWDSDNAVFTKWKGYSACYAKAWDMVLVGGYNGEIYKIRPDVFQNAGESIRTYIRTGHFGHGTYDEKISHELILRVKRGAGTVSGDEPVFTIRWRNQDQIWKQEKQISLGKIGDYDIFKRLHRLGTYRTRQYEIVHTANSDFILAGIEENLDLF